MKDFKAYLKGKIRSCKNSIAIYDTNKYVLLEDCVSALEKAYNDGLNDRQKKMDEVKRPIWKDDYEAYLSIVKDSRESLLFDDRHKALFLKYNPRCDYKATIEKSIEMFWGTEEGWNYCKKKRKGKTLDMVATLRKNLERNRVYVNAKDSYVQSRIAEIDSKMKEEQFR